MFSLYYLWKILFTRKLSSLGEWQLSQLQSPSLETLSHLLQYPFYFSKRSSNSLFWDHHQLPCHILLNLVHSISIMIWEKPEVDGNYMQANRSLSCNVLVKNLTWDLIVHCECDGCANSVRFHRWLSNHAGECLLIQLSPFWLVAKDTQPILEIFKICFGQTSYFILSLALLISYSSLFLSYGGQDALCTNHLINNKRL